MSLRGLTGDVKLVRSQYLGGWHQVAATAADTGAPSEFPIGAVRGGRLVVPDVPASATPVFPLADADRAEAPVRLRDRDGAERLAEVPQSSDAAPRGRPRGPVGRAVQGGIKHR